MKRFGCWALIIALALSFAAAPALAEGRLLEGKKLSYWYPMWAWESEFVGAGDMGDLNFYKELEEATGCEIEWILPPVDNDAAIAAYNVLVASSDLPDIITHPYYTYYPGGADKAIEDGVYIDLADLLPVYAPDYWALINEDPQLLRQVTTDEGHIWCFYMIDSFAQPSYGGPVWRKDFIDAVGGQVPVTVEEMHSLLLAFKNELGIERPMYDDASSYLPFAFGVQRDFLQDENGAVAYGPALEGWREYLTVMQQWYGEGLLPPDYITPPTNSTEVIEGKVGVLHAGFNNITEWTSLAAAANVEGFELVASPYPKQNAEDVLKLKSVYAFRAQQNCTAITTACEDPIAAVQWLNAKFTDEFIEKSNYGEEGVSFEYVDGKPAYLDAIVHPTEPGMTLGILLYKYALGKGPYYRVMDRNWFTHLPSAIDAMYTWEGSTDGGSGGIPDVFLSMPAEEGEEYSAIMADIVPYVKECQAKFIQGELSLETDWDGYLSTLESMDLERATQIKQAALDRYRTR